MTLLIANYASFSYNLYQLVGELDPGIRVIRNDELTLDEIRALHPAHIILSPGPGRPGWGRCPWCPSRGTIRLRPWRPCLPGTGASPTSRRGRGR